MMIVSSTLILFAASSWFYCKSRARAKPYRCSDTARRNRSFIINCLSNWTTTAERASDSSLAPESVGQGFKPPHVRSACPNLGRHQMRCLSFDWTWLCRITFQSNGMHRAWCCTRASLAHWHWTSCFEYLASPRFQIRSYTLYVVMKQFLRRIPLDFRVW